MYPVMGLLRQEVCSQTALDAYALLLLISFIGIHDSGLVPFLFMCKSGSNTFAARRCYLQRTHTINALAVDVERFWARISKHM